MYFNKGSQPHLKQNINTFTHLLFPYPGYLRASVMSRYAHKHIYSKTGVDIISLTNYKHPIFTNALDYAYHSHLHSEFQDCIVRVET